NATGNGSGADYVVAIGTDALKVASGDYNIAIGWRASDATAAGIDNVAIGSDALGANTSGSSNVAIGGNDLLSSDEDSRQVGIGKDALKMNTGGGNIAIGFQAGDSITTGYNNLLIGTNVDTPAVGTANWLNIGDSIFGDLSTDKISIGTTTITTALNVNGSI